MASIATLNTDRAGGGFCGLFLLQQFSRIDSYRPGAPAEPYPVSVKEGGAYKISPNRRSFTRVKPEFSVSDLSHLLSLAYRLRLPAAFALVPFPREATGALSFVEFFTGER